MCRSAGVGFGGSARTLLLLGAFLGSAVAPADAVEEPVALFVFDASGSMLEQVKEGGTKDEMARSILAKALADLPESVTIGLVAFGHRRAKDCSDLELVAPIGTDRGAITTALRTMKSKGETPIADALRLASRTLGERGGEGVIVVLSDGREECGGDPCAAAREAVASGAQVRIHVVGLDLSPEEAKELACIAEEGHGRYFPAASAEQLSQALEAVQREVILEPPAERSAPTRCLHDVEAFRARTEPLRCPCLPEAMAIETGVWGTDVYTDDSSVCGAAVHAGVIGPKGGTVVIEPLPGQAWYPGSGRNGVTSGDFSSFPGSFGFVGGARPSLVRCPGTMIPSPAITCKCSPEALADGAVWGTDVYTADSSLCRSALHAGVVGVGGGVVNAIRLPGQQTYPASERNGVVSEEYGSWDASLGFRK